MYDILPIKNYIEYLISGCGLSITIHPIACDSIISSSELIHFNIHNNPYCIYLKSCKEAQEYCISRQKKVLDRCAGGSYSGVCHAGVKEYIYPISDGEKNIGFVSVSGYKTERSSEYLQNISSKYNLPIDELEKSYSKLNETLPDKKSADTLIEPLCRMLELASIKTGSDNELSLSLARKVMNYIRKNHNRPLSSKDICEEFSCSRSYISTVFKNETGKTIRDYINILRINDAETLLKYSNLTVTQIAFSVGFSDSNYFTEVFKKYAGISPVKYRKSKSFEKSGI